MGRFDLALGRKGPNKLAVCGVDVREMRFLVPDAKGGPPIQSTTVSASMGEARELKRAGVTADDCLNWLSAMHGEALNTGRWHVYLTHLFENDSEDQLLGKLWESDPDVRDVSDVFGTSRTRTYEAAPRLTTEEVIHEMLRQDLPHSEEGGPNQEESSQEGSSQDEPEADQVWDRTQN